MARVTVSPVSLIGLIADIIEIPANTGSFRFKKVEGLFQSREASRSLDAFDWGDYDSYPPPESDASSSLTSYECDWWYDLVLGLQAAKGLMYSATSYEARKSSVSILNHSQTIENGIKSTKLWNFTNSLDPFIGFTSIFE